MATVDIRDSQVAPTPGGAVQATHFVREVHDLVRDLLVPSRNTYWCDFLVSVSLAYVSFFVFQFADPWSAVQVAFFVVCAVAMYRSVIFVHEIEHRPERSMRSFAVAWNVLCGIPFAMPSFLYHDHRGHHSNVSYGTERDAEYLSLIRNRKLRATAFLGIAIVYPVLGPLRFLLLTPIMLAVPAVNRIGWKYFSSMYMLNPSYRRPFDDEARSIGRWTQEVAACIWAWSCVGLWWFGVINTWAVVNTYLVFLAWIMTNQVRTITAHRYGLDGESSHHVAQMLDSNTFPFGPVAELWAPVGLRYHALHHVLPSMPYHAMGTAHRRLMRELPPGSPYRETIRPNLMAALRESFTGRRGSHPGERSCRD